MSILNQFFDLNPMLKRCLETFDVVYTQHLTTNSPQPTAHCQQPTAYSKQPTAYSPQPAAHKQQPTANSTQPTAHSPQPTTRSQQPTANSQQPTAHSQQPTAHSQTSNQATVFGSLGSGWAGGDLRVAHRILINFGSQICQN